MKFVILPRGTGKTTVLLDALRDDEVDLLLFPTQHQAREAFGQAARRGDEVRTDMFLSLHVFMTGATRGRVTPDTRVGIDEVDGVLSRLLNITVTIATGTDTILKEN